ncbi:OmpH family outer membrane protein [bacterium]|nr:OmpH family outer membrane protein [bacterium]
MKIEFRTFMPFLLVATLVALAVMAGMVIAPVKAQSTYATIGYVDVQEALASHPDLQDVLTQIQAFEDARTDELSSYQELDSLTEAERQQMVEDLDRVRDEVDRERQRLTEPLIQDVIDATTAIGEESGIEVILEAGSVMWGGLNLTPLIINHIQGS